MRKILFTVFATLAIGLVSMAQDACPVLVDEALGAVGTACASTERNQACYGNIAIEASGRTPAFAFARVGDIVNVNEIERLQLAPFDLDKNEWGVVLMNVQANLPDTFPGQGVRVLLFGDVAIAGDETLDLSNGFYFTSGVSDSPCKGVPNSGILVQTPSGAGKITLTVNDVTVSLGSTAFLQAEAGAFMTIDLLEGEADVTAEGETVVLEAGFSVSVPLDEDGRASGIPSEPLPIQPNEDAPLDALLATLPEGTAQGDSLMQLGIWRDATTMQTFTCDGFSMSVPVDAVDYTVISATTEQLILYVPNAEQGAGMIMVDGNIVMPADGAGGYTFSASFDSAQSVVTITPTSLTEAIITFSVEAEGTTCIFSPRPIMYIGN